MNRKSNPLLDIIQGVFYLLVILAFLAGGIAYIVWTAKIFPNSLIAAVIMAIILWICVTISERYKRRRNIHGK